ncbi:MAG: hypothetical protein FIA96_08800 [Betaproteobacteria bacterium]|nr:hypothetical protein [Betaproteobacteria bacterium]
MPRNVNPTAKKVLPAPQAKRRRAVDGGAPARRSEGAENPSYAGYEYQITATVWVALDLMFAKDVTDQLVVEPRSHEDIEAAVRDSTAALLGLEASLGSFDLVVQVKSRSTAPWSTTAVADVLLGEPTDGAVSSGLSPRARPLAMLKASPSQRYIFITNESLHPSLRPHASDGLLDFPDVTQLPPHARRGFDDSAQRSIAPRIALCSGVTLEVLDARIAALLTTYGHIPGQVSRLACLRDLRDEVRLRMGKRESGVWAKADLLQVIRRHGGSALPNRAMDHYVKPSSFDAVRDTLLNKHAVVITGSSGTGKTLTADILENELKSFPAPFMVVTEEGGPSRVRQEMKRAEPLLLHLHDPWGTNRVEPQADRWANELPKLLTSASPDRKFLVTSRADVLRSAGSSLAKQLTPYTVRIDVEDYGPTRLAEIYDLMCRGLAGHALDLAQMHRQQALRSLKRPYEIDRFIFTLSNEDPRKLRQLHEIVRESQIEAISSVVADQVAGLQNGGVACAAIIWAMLGARGAIPNDLVSKLRRWIRQQHADLNLELDAFVDTMVHARNLKRDGPLLTIYHPRVEDGLRMALERSPGDVENVLSALVDALVASDAQDADWGVETALKVFRNAKTISNVELSLSAATRLRLDAFLEMQANVAQNRDGFARALSDLALYGSEIHTPSSLARLLVDGAPTERSSFQGRTWRAPAISKEVLHELRVDPRSSPIVHRFVREVLPTSDTEYGTAVVGLLRSIEPDIDADFSAALDVLLALGGVGHSIDALVLGNCQGETPDFDGVIERAARANDEVDEWMKKFSKDIREAEEHEVDAILADHVIEEPGESYYNSNEVLQAVAGLRRVSQGVSWVETHPHRPLLIPALLDSLAHIRKEFPYEQLRALMELAEGWNKVRAWRIALEHWEDGFNDLLEVEICRDDLEPQELREILARSAVINGLLDERDSRRGLPIDRMTPMRRIQLVYDMFTTTVDKDGRGEAGKTARHERATRVVGHCDPAEGNLALALISVLQGNDLRTSARGLSVDGLDLLSSLLPALDPSLAAPMVCLAAAAKLDPIDVARRLLDRDDADEGVAAVTALVVYGDDRSLTMLRGALTHGRYRVRRSAMNSLIELGFQEDRALILRMARDRGADVRLGWADAMRKQQWPEAVDPLVELLSDERNFGAQPGYFAGPMWAHYAVARSAADALGAYEKLPQSAIDALLLAAVERGADPLVACAALSALGSRDDSRVERMLLDALQAPGLTGAPSYKPLSQTAGWSLFDRAIAGLLKVRADDEALLVRLCRDGNSAIAGPIIACVAVLGGDIRRSLISVLRSGDKPERFELLRVASVAADKAIKGEASGAISILESFPEEDPDGIAPDSRAEVEAWSLSLDVSRDVQGVTAWVLATIFSLPVADKDFDPRALELPRRIGVMTMRSLSPNAEEVCE